MPDISNEQYFNLFNHPTAVFSQQYDDRKGYCSSDMATVTMSSKHQPFTIYLVFLLFSYISSGNHFHASGAINNNEYCSITKQHTMCSPEVIYLFLSTFHLFHFILLSTFHLIIRNSSIFVITKLDFNIFVVHIGLWPPMWLPKRII